MDSLAYRSHKASKSDKGTENTHPTVKSTKLMEYLIKLIAPENGIVLDPFVGSGSTGVAVVKNDFGFIGIEKEQEYFEIAKQRIDNVRKDNGQSQGNTTTQREKGSDSEVYFEGTNGEVTLWSAF